MFNMSDTICAAKENFFTEDMTIDVLGAEHTGVDALSKQYTFETIGEWFDYVATFDMTDMVMTDVELSKDAGQLWQRFSGTLTSKASGRSVALESLTIYHMRGDKFEKISIVYADPMVFAYLDGTVETRNEASKLPEFEPHPNPKATWDAALDAWASGAFTKAETKQAAMDEFIHPEGVVDASSAALPEPFAVLHGHTGVDKWNNEIIGKWEITRMELTPMTGLKPGCVLQKLDCDAKYDGKEAKGIVMYSEIAYDADGKCIYMKIYWANPQVVASLYAATDSES